MRSPNVKEAKKAVKNKSTSKFSKYMMCSIAALLAGTSLVSIMLLKSDSLLNYVNDGTVALTSTGIGRHTDVQTVISSVEQESASSSAGVNNAGGSSANTPGVSSGQPVSTLGGGQLDSSATATYGIPFYDDVTLSTAELGCRAWEIDFTSIGDSSAREKASPGHVTVSCMGYGACSASSRQGTLMNGADAYTNDIGVRMVDGRVCFALAPWVWDYPENVTSGEVWNYNGHSHVGFYFDIVMSDGSVIPGIVGDSKGVTNPADSVLVQGSKYTCPVSAATFSGINFQGIYCHGDGSILELIRDGSATQEVSWAKYVCKGSTLGISKIIMYDYDYLSKGACFSN